MTQDTSADDDSFGHWFAGFVDGEGCFDIKRVGEHFICRFAIGLRQDDVAILEQIQRWTGIGDVYVIERRAEWTGQAQARWEVSRKAEVAQLAGIFERYSLRAKKARDLVIWQEAVTVWLNLRKGSRWHGRSPATARLAELKAIMQDGREYNAAEPAIIADAQLKLVA